MLNIIDKIQTKKHEYENGKKIDSLTITPFGFLNEISNIFLHQELPVYWRNKDKYHKQNQSEIVAALCEAIKQEYKRSTALLKNYDEETPRNKLVHWGEMFEAVRTVLKKNFSDEHLQNVQHVSYKEYKNIPKRYLSAIRLYNNQRHCDEDNGLPYYALKYPDFQNAPFKFALYGIVGASKLHELTKKIGYDCICSREEEKKDFIVTDKNWDGESGDKSEHGYYETIYRAKPITDIFASYFISDKQIQTLLDTYEKIKQFAAAHILIQEKFGAYDASGEYFKTKSKKDSVLKSYRHVRKQKQKFDTKVANGTMSEQTAKKLYQIIHAQALEEIAKNINTRIK